MSVRKGDRTQGKLEVLKLATNLCIYTMQLCRNEKIFPKSQRWLLTQRIINEALDGMTCVRRANATLVGEGTSAADNFRYRHGQQVEAHAHYGALYSLVDLAYNMGYIDSGRVENWTAMISDTDDKLKAWMRSNQNDYLSKNK